MTRTAAVARVLVAGVGNIFLGDDGFGPEVLRNLVAPGGCPWGAAPERPPESSLSGHAPRAEPAESELSVQGAGAVLTDYGIRGMHLAYDLLDGWDALVLVDAVPSRGAPGTVHVLRVSADGARGAGLDAHGMDPASVLANLRALGGQPPPTYLVGCEAATVADGIGLSAPVAAAVPVAADAVRRLLASIGKEVG